MIGETDAGAERSNARRAHVRKPRFACVLSCTSANRSWHRLASLWHDLVQRGCSPSRLREQSLLTADCGLGSHGVPVAERVSQSLRDIGRAVRSDATAAKLMLGG